LAESHSGYQNLSRLITHFKLREKTKAEGAAWINEMEQHSHPPARAREKAALKAQRCFIGRFGKSISLAFSADTCVLGLPDSR
jgi:hypothetical protein